MTNARNGLLLALALLAGCGGGSGTTSQGGAGTPPPLGTVTPTVDPPATPAPVADPILTPEVESVPARAFIRMLGVNNPGYAAILADVASITVEVDGVPVALDFSGVQTMDLTNPDHAWRLASFAMPPPGSTVVVTVRLDDPAIWERGEASGELDTCGLPITFSAPAEWLALRGHAVIVLDLERSILEVDGDALLLPNLQVKY